MPADLAVLSALELVELFRRGEATPDEALAAGLARIAEKNPVLNAVVTLDEAGAREAANASTARWHAGTPRSPLDGVPLTIKDSLWTKGLRTTWGSALYADFIPPEDEPAVAKLRAAGAVILGKTNVPELTVHGFTDNALFGPTRNPWDVALTPGGSSGGAVAAVAAGMGPLTLGTDGGGSTRRPAAHTGLIGLKPSRSAIAHGGFPATLHDFQVVGLIGREIGDVTALFDILGAPEQNATPDQKPLRILFAPTFGDAPVDPSIATAIEQVAKQFESDGHHVETAASFDLSDAIPAIWPVVSESGVAWLVSQHANGHSRVGPAIAAMAESGATRPATEYIAALQATAAMTRAFDELFTRYDLLLTPTTAAMPWPATQSHPVTIAGKPVGPRGHAVFTPFANAAGLPAISLPCAVASSTLPIGFQLAAARGRDRFLLGVAAEHLAHRGWRYRFPDFATFPSAKVIA